MTRRPAGIAVAVASLLVAAVLVGGQVLASAGTPAPRGTTPSPAAATESGDDDDCTADEGCGNEHSRAIHAWVACKAEKPEDACVKPTPPGQALGHTKRSGTAPGPAGADGRGHGWGRAHAPGQLKDKKATSDDGGDEDDKPAG